MVLMLGHLAEGHSGRRRTLKAKLNMLKFIWIFLWSFGIMLRDQTETFWTYGSAVCLMQKRQSLWAEEHNLHGQTWRWSHLDMGCFAVAGSGNLDC